MAVIFLKEIELPVLARHPRCDFVLISSEFVLVLFELCLCLCRDPGDCPSLVLVLVCCTGSRIVVSDGYQTQRRGSWIPGKERAERVLAGAITIDGRKEWI